MTTLIEAWPVMAVFLLGFGVVLAIDWLAQRGRSS